MFVLNFDISQLVSFGQTLQPTLKAAAAQAAQMMVPAAHAHMMELASQRLHSRLQKFTKGISIKQEDDSTWLIILDKSAAWIDDGMCVVYGAGRTTPLVLTIDGWKKNIDIRVGDLVLNHEGKWTEVLAVHDRHLFSWCLESFDDAKTFEMFGYRASDLSPQSRKPVVMVCNNCGVNRTVSNKQGVARAGHPPFCKVCSRAEDLIQVGVSFGKDTKKQRGFSSKRFILTPNHPVLTANGWVAARDLKDGVELMSPVWGACLQCDKKTFFGNDFCSSSCVASNVNSSRLASGTHVSQRPEWLRDVYKKQIALGHRVSGAEIKFAEALSERFNVVFYDKDMDITAGNLCIRQMPVSAPDDIKKRKRYYWLDFYIPSLNLGIEVDGKAFHSGKNVGRDKLRDAHIKANTGIDVIRIPAKIAYRPRQMKKILEDLFANHNGDIELRPKVAHVKRVKVGPDFSMLRAWDITVAEGSSFVCQGVVIHNSSHEMIDDLLKGKGVKTSKDGSRYRSIPFEHGPGKGAASMTPAQLTLQQTIKDEMKKRNIPYGKIEKDAKGNPLSGMLHSFDVHNGPPKTAEGPGQGWGKIGQPRQGPTGIPFLHGVRVYQKLVENAKGEKSAKRAIMTFRTVSSKMKGTGRWVHPGLQPTKIFEDTVEWAHKEWDTNIAPKILDFILSNT